MPRQHPWLQGELDSLCGLYAVLNVTQLLVPEAGDDELAQTLFGLLVSEHARARTLKAAVVTGTNWSQIGTAIRIVSQALQRRGLGALRWSRPLSRRRDLDALPDLWAAMRTLLDRADDRDVLACALIIAWEGFEPHWTVVRRISKRHLHLFNSSGEDRLPRNQCSTDPDVPGRPYWLVPVQILLIERIVTAP